MWSQTRAGTEYFPVAPREPHGVGEPRTLDVARRECKDRAALPGKADQFSSLTVRRVMVGLSISLE
jgi:hypothetical protein